MSLFNEPVKCVSGRKDDKKVVFNHIKVDTVYCNVPLNNTMSIINKMDSASRKSIDWAIDNSYNGLHVNVQYDHSNLVYVYVLYVYLTDEDATFWKLQKP